jgi:hypothetical protein
VAQEQLQIRLDAVDNTKKAFNSLNNNTNKAKQALLNLKNVLIGIGAGLALKSISNVTANFEDLRDSLSAVTGSAKEGASAFAFIQDFALRSQFSVEELTTSFITLKASGIQPTEKLLRVFTDTASVTTDQLGTLDALTRVFSRGIQGGLGLEELNQIADRGVPVFRLLEEEIGLGRLEIAKFGQTTDGARKILDALEKTLGTTFKGATQEKLDNLSTAGSNLGIAFRNFQDVIGQSGFGKAVADLFNSLSDLLGNLKPLATLLGTILGLFAKLANLIIKSVNVAITKLGNGIQFIIDKYQELKRLLGLAPLTITINANLEFDDFITGGVFEQSQSKLKEFLNILQKEVGVATDALDTKFKNINETISKGIVTGVQSISKGLAETLILGKSLSDTFRQLAQQILVNIISKTIERIILMGLEKVLSIFLTDQEAKKENFIRKQNSALKQQIALQAILTALGGGGGFFGFAEGGRVNGSRANGGQTSNGNAYMVGERGRELFIPSTDGQIVPNEKLGGLGSTNISFTVQATDVKGVKELLIDNRATITNIINSALNQKGKPALI